MCPFQNTETVFTFWTRLSTVVISKNDTMIAVGDWLSEGRVQMFSVSYSDHWDFKLVNEEKIHIDVIRFLVFSDDDKYLLSCSDDFTVGLTDAKNS